MLIGQVFLYLAAGAKAVSSTTTGRAQLHGPKTTRIAKISPDLLLRLGFLNQPIDPRLLHLGCESFGAPEIARCIVVIPDI